MTADTVIADWPGFCARLFDKATAAVDPSITVAPHLPDPTGFDAVKVIAFGKSAARMAQAVEQAWPDVALSGLAVCRYGYAVPCDKIEVMEAAHPVPDTAATAAAERALEIARSVAADELLLVLVSGGGSSLMCLPAPGIDLAEKQRITSALLRSGANIHEINTVRRQLSAIKGGRLAEAAARAGQIVTLAISDVVGDVPADIASGPTVANPTTEADAAAVLLRYGVKPPPVWPDVSSAGEMRGSFQIIANASRMLDAAEALAREAGLAVIRQGDRLTGEAREVAMSHAVDLAWMLPAINQPTLLLSGGELTVTVRGGGQGGPNQEYLLALAHHLADLPNIYGFAADTDGIDGTGGATGAMIWPGQQEAALPGLLSACLADNDSLRYFRATGGSFTAPVPGTNVNDLRAILLLPDAAK